MIKYATHILHSVSDELDCNIKQREIYKLEMWLLDCRLYFNDQKNNNHNVYGDNVLRFKE